MHLGPNAGADWAQWKGPMLEPSSSRDLYIDIFCRWQSYYGQSRREHVTATKTTKWRYQYQISAAKCQAVNLRAQNKATTDKRQTTNETQKHEAQEAWNRFIADHQALDQVSAY